MIAGVQSSSGQIIFSVCVLMPLATQPDFPNNWLVINWFYMCIWNNESTRCLITWSTGPDIHIIIDWKEIPNIILDETSFAKKKTVSFDAPTQLCFYAKTFQNKKKSFFPRKNLFIASILIISNLVNSNIN